MTALSILIWALLCALAPFQAHAVIVEKIAAVVNQDVITLSEVDEVVDSLHASELAAIQDPQKRKARRDTLRKEVLDQMIDQRILTQQYERLQITANEEDVDRTINAICRQNGIQLETLKAEISRQGLTYQEYRNQIRQHILQSKLVEQQIRPRISVTEEDIKQLYTRQIGELATKEVVELSGILVPLPRGGGPEAIDIARRKAAEARRLLQEGLAPDEIAKQYGDGSVLSLGEMGKFSAGELMEPLNTAVFRLDPGKVTEPLEASQGLYVIKVISKGRQNPEDVLPYEEVRDQLYQRYYNEQIETQLKVFIQNARRDSHVEILL